MLASDKRDLLRLTFGFLRICLGCLLASGIVVLGLRLIDANVLGFTQLVWIRTWLVFATFAHLAAVFVYIGQPVGVLLVMVIPFLTQYYQVCLGREYPDGATSLMRLAPLLVMALAMAVVVFSRRPSFSRTEIVAVLSLLAISAYAWVQSTSRSVSGPTCFFLLAVLTPLFYFYCGYVVQSSPAGAWRLALGVALGLWILLVGTVGTVLLGLKVEIAAASGTLLGTQSMADFNTVYTYIVLAWPFAFILLKRLHWSMVATLAVVMIVAAGLGFSRTTALITPALLGLSFLSYAVYSNRRTLKVVTALGLAAVVGLNTWTGLDQVLEVWAARFDVNDLSADEVTLGAMLQSVKPGSRSANDRLEILAAAMEVFRRGPVLGSGWGTFQALSGTTFTTAHNLTADILVETGLIGVIYFNLLLAAILATLVRLFLIGGGVRADVLLMLATFGLWLAVVHTLGGSLHMASATGFQVNAITALLLALYLRHDAVAGLLRIDRQPAPT